MIRFALAAFFFVLMSGRLLADIAWPALWVANSYYRVWYMAVAGTVLEAVVISKCCGFSWSKSASIAVAANVITATVGMALMLSGMLLWHILFDDFLGGTFSDVNNAASFILMFLGTVILEAFFLWGTGKVPLRKALWIMSLGNVLSYGMILVDAYFLGGITITF